MTWAFISGFQPVEWFQWEGQFSHLSFSNTQKDNTIRSYSRHHNAFFSFHASSRDLGISNMFHTRGPWSSGCFSEEAFSCINCCCSHENFWLICFLIYHRASVEAAGCFKTQRELVEATISGGRGLEFISLVFSVLPWLSCNADISTNSLLFQIRMVTLNLRQLVYLKTCYFSSSDVFPFLGCCVFFPSYWWVLSLVHALLLPAKSVYMAPSRQKGVFSVWLVLVAPAQLMESPRKRNAGF